MIITFTNVIGAIRNAASEAAEVITSGLQMWLGFEESEVIGTNQIVQDKSPNSNVAALFTGKALDFDGSEDYINIPSFSISGTRTFVIWFKSSSSFTGRRLFNLVTDTGNCNVTLSNGSLNCYDGSNNPETNASSFNDGIWHRAVFVMVDDAFEIYVDGVSQTLDTTNWENKDASSGQMRIGADTGTTGIDGQISSAEIYDVAWSQADVTYDYANPNKLVTTKTSPSISLSNLVGYWALSEGSGSIAYDSSGAGNYGTINGAEYVVGQPRIPQLSMQDFSNEIQNLVIDPPAVNGTTLTIVGDEYILNGYSGGGIFWGGIPKEAGATYEVTFEITEFTSGLGVRWFPESSTYRKSVGVFTETLTVTTATTLRMFSNGANAMKIRISNCSWKKVDGAKITLIPNPTIPSQDILGQAVRSRDNSFNLDGSGYSSADDSSTLQFGTNAFTIQAWIKPFSLAADNRILTKGVTGNGEFMISVGGDNASIRVYAKDSSGNALDTSNDFSSLTADSWQMITVIIDTPNDQILFFKDDGSVESKTGASWSGNFNNTEPITIGNTSSVSAGQFFNGLVSDARVYDRLLTSSEVENNYNAGQAAHTN